jgi:hypothetical protein
MSRPQLLSRKNKIYRFPFKGSEIPLKYKLSKCVDIVKSGGMDKDAIYFCCTGIDGIDQLTRRTTVKIACQFEMDIVTVLMCQDLEIA